MTWRLLWLPWRQPPDRDGRCRHVGAQLTKDDNDNNKNNPPDFSTWVTGARSHRIPRPDLEHCHSPSAKVKNGGLILHNTYTWRVLN
jgi:hypothetical protein